MKVSGEILRDVIYFVTSNDQVKVYIVIFDNKYKPISVLSRTPFSYWLVVKSE